MKHIRSIGCQWFLLGCAIMWVIVLGLIVTHPQ